PRSRPRRIPSTRRARCRSVPGVPVTLARGDLDSLSAALRALASTRIAPRVKSGSIAYDEIASADDLPAGWVDVQDGGTFRLERSGADALCAHAVEHDSLRRFLSPPQLHVWKVTRGQAPAPVAETVPRYAFLG